MPFPAGRQAARLSLVVSNNTPVQVRTMTFIPVQAVRCVVPFIADHSPGDEPYDAMMGPLHGIGGCLRILHDVPKDPDSAGALE